jgi:hypothetical protein
MKFGVQGALPDPLAGFFRNLFGKNSLVDVQPAELVPTWRNGRIGTHGIQKRLDRVYVSKRSWLIQLGTDPGLFTLFSDHAPVFFSWNMVTFSCLPIQI